MGKHGRALLVEGPVGKTLVKLTIPMIFGLIGIVAFNLVDTFYVGRLGTDELAALSFTFPVVLIIASLALGLGVGTSSVVSRAIGEGNQHKVQRLTTDSLMLSVLIVFFFVVFGLLTVNSVFRLLGATRATLPLIRRYMMIWYPGVIFVIVPMVGNNAIRATGDTKTPSLIMMVAAVMNMILDPLFIFGIGPFPRLEMAGAAIATVIARAVTLVVSLYILYGRLNMITLERVRLRDVLQSWKQILFIGLPNAGTRMVVPLATAVITRLLSSYGRDAVAAFGVSIRIEFFALTVFIAFSTIFGPFVGQNLGAASYDRVKRGVKFGKGFSIIWGMMLFLVLAVFARSIASLFNDNASVVRMITLYLRIVPLGYGLQGVLLLSVATLNVLKKPLQASMLTVVQMFVLYLPLAFAGSQLFGVIGVFAALALSYCIAGLLSHLVLGRIMVNQLNT
jgi:putative MATE family efflux protein